MLQINSGKLYANGAGRTNSLRGVIYSNVSLRGIKDEPVTTEAGTLRETESFGHPFTIVYELTEQIEDGRSASGVLVSHGVQPYLADFAYVASFVLQATCTPDHSLCSRLLSGSRSPGIRTKPDKLVSRVFDKEIWLQTADTDRLKAFVSALIALERKSFLATMRAIRTYVTGIQRVTDDLELAYTLLVASIESLAQDFDGHKAVWEDYEEGKRNRIDDALTDGMKRPQAKFDQPLSRSNILHWDDASVTSH